MNIKKWLGWALLAVMIMAASPIPTQMMQAPPTFGGVIPPAPSGASYSATANQILEIPAVDQSFMATLGFKVVSGYNGGTSDSAAGVSVLQYGARCNGSTDDTAAMALAFNSGASLVTIPDGQVCYSASGVVVPTKVTLMGWSFSPAVVAGGSQIMCAADVQRCVTISPGSVLRSLSVTRQGGQPSVLSAPAVPVLGSVAGGALSGATYFVKITYVTASGETTGSTEASLAVAGSRLLTVASPTPATGARGYNVYVSTGSGTEAIQTVSEPIAIGTDWTLPTAGLGAATKTVSAENTASYLYGVYADQASQSQVENVNVINHGVGFMLYGGLHLEFSHIYTANISDAHMVIDSSPEVYLEQGRFSPGYTSNTNIRLTASISAPAMGPNTLHAHEMQFNNTTRHWLEFINDQYSTNDQELFTFMQSHVEGVSAAYVMIDRSWPSLAEVVIDGMRFNDIDIPFFDSTSDTTYTGVRLTNNRSDGGFSLTGPIFDLALTANKFDGQTTITQTSSAGSANFTGNTFASASSPSLTVTGASRSTSFVSNQYANTKNVNGVSSGLADMDNGVNVTGEIHTPSIIDVGTPGAGAPHVINGGVNFVTTGSDINTIFSDVAAFAEPFQILDASLNAGSNIQMRIGVANSGFNDGIITFNYNGAGDSSNSIELQLFGGTGGVILHGSGALSLGGGSTANLTLSSSGYQNCTGLTTNGSGLVGCTASDARVKNDHGTISPFEGLLRILNNPDPHDFTFKEGYGPAGHHEGFFAQDMMQVRPELVHRGPVTDLTPDGELQFDQSSQVATLVQAVKAQQTEIRALAVIVVILVFWCIGLTIACRKVK